MRLSNVWTTLKGLPLPAKVAGGAAALLLLGRASAAHADTGPAPAARGGMGGGRELGDQFVLLAAGDRVRMPESFHLRSRPVASNAGAPSLPPQVVTIESQAPQMRRGAREAGYRVRVEDGRVGYVFVPANAARA